MKKAIWVTGAVVLVILAIWGTWVYQHYYFYENSSDQIKRDRYSEITYDSCIIGGNKSSECEQYIFTRNAKMEQKLTEIVDQVIKEQAVKGVIISAKKIEVFNLAWKVEGLIELNCEDMNSVPEETIIESIAAKLIENYPDDFAEKVRRDSWVDVRCDGEFGWRIADGGYDMLI